MSKRRKIQPRGIGAADEEQDSPMRREAPSTSSVCTRIIAVPRLTNLCAEYFARTFVEFRGLADSPDGSERWNKCAAYLQSLPDVFATKIFRSLCAICPTFLEHKIIVTVIAQILLHIYSFSYPCTQVFHAERQRYSHIRPPGGQEGDGAPSSRLPDAVPPGTLRVRDICGLGICRCLERPGRITNRQSCASGLTRIVFVELKTVYCTDEAAKLVPPR